MVDSLSVALAAALQTLVSWAGGWGERRGRGQPYCTSQVRRSRVHLAELQRLERLARRAMEVDAGPWPWEVTRLCQKMRDQGVQVPSGTLLDLRAWEVQEIRGVKGRLSRMMAEMRRERYAR